MHAPGRKSEPKCFRAAVPALHREPLQGAILESVVGDLE